MRDSQLSTKHHKALLSTDVEALRAASSFAAFVLKFDASSVPLLAWLTLLQATICSHPVIAKKKKNANYSRRMKDLIINDLE